jgi:branched-chain amino acid transport system substrate-binding protein
MFLSRIPPVQEATLNIFHRCLMAMLAGAALSATHNARADIPLAGITEVKGGGAVAGTSFRRGYQLAIEEINAAGGVLGERLSLTQFDIETAPAAAVDAAKSAVALKPFAILGPVFSGVTLAAMSATQTTGIPHFTGGEAASVARKFHPTIMRTSLSQQGAVPRLAALTAYGLGAKRIALLSVDNEFGRDARGLLREALTRRGAVLEFDGSVSPGQADVDDVVQRALATKPDAVLLYLNEGESVIVLKSIRKHGYEGHVVGDGPLVSAQVIEAAGAAAENVVAHTGISVDLQTPRMRSFVAGYVKRFGAKPDHNAVKGYFAVQVVKAGLTRLGKADMAGFMSLVKNTRLEGRANPDLMTTVSYDWFGDLNRESYFVQVKGGSTEILGTLSAMDTPFFEFSSGKSLPLNSNELRRELLAALTKPLKAAAAPQAKTTTAAR